MIKLPCKFCGAPAYTRDLCSLHYQRARKGTSMTAPSPKPKGSGSLTVGGYVQIVVDGERKLEHRVLMENHLGRRLFEGENVHHKNGIRNDNRIENLELWSVNPPYGQRVEDKIKWAIEFLTEYGYEVKEVSN